MNRNRLLLTLAVACATLLPLPGAIARAQDSNAGQASPPADKSAPPAQGASGQVPQGQQPGGLMPLNAVDPPVYAIPDIRAHRGVELPYVRRAADYVKLNLPPIDFSADPVLVIGDRAVSRNEYRRRALMYAGGNEVDKHVTHLLTQQEIDRQAAAFADELAKTETDPAVVASKVAEFKKKFELDEATIDRKYQELKELLAQQARQGAQPNPGDPDPGEAAIKEWEDSIKASIGMEAYRQLLAADAAFEKVFMPFPEGKVEGVAHDMKDGPPPLDEPRPDWMPQTTWDALGSDDQGRNLRSFVKAWAIEGTGIPAMFKPSILARVRDGLTAQAGVAFFFDEDLPDDAFMRVGKQMVPISDIWYLVENKLSDTDNRLIVRELLTLDAMKRSLKAATKMVQPPAPEGADPAAPKPEAKRVSAWLDDEDFAKVWYDHNQEYVGTLFPLKNIILFRGYTSLDRYREHFRYRQAFNLWRKSTLTDEEVIEHYQGGGRLFFERGNLVVDIAFNPIGTKPFNDTSLEASRQELEKAMADAKANWTKEQSGEKPVAEAAAPDAAPADAAKPGDAAWFDGVTRQLPSPPSRQGNDGHHFQRSQLRMQMAEDELSIFLTGYSFADDVFYHGQKGEVYGPWPEACRVHAWGAEANAGSWALAIKDFVRSGPVGAFEGRAKDLAYEDYLDLNYFNWAQEGLRALLPSVRVPSAK